jgi:hypothetical protein
MLWIHRGVIPETHERIVQTGNFQNNMAAMSAICKEELRPDFLRMPSRQAVAEPHSRYFDDPMITSHGWARL